MQKNCNAELIADETVEGVVLKKNNDGEFEVELVDNIRKIVVKSRVGKLKTEDSEEAE